MFKTYQIAAIVCALALFPGLGFAEDTQEFKGDPYALGVCSVSGEKLGSMGDPISVTHEGRDIRFCCAGCKPKFQGDPKSYLSKIDAMMVEDQKQYYPLDTDLVSGDALGSDTIDIVHFNRLVRLGSQMSAQKFYKNPDKYIAKLDDAVIAAQIDSYPITTCVVSGESLDVMGDPIQVVVANRLVQFCCAGCLAKLQENPHGILSKLSGDAPAGGDDEGSDHK